MTNCHSHSTLNKFALEESLQQGLQRLRILKHLRGSPFGATHQTLLHYYKECTCPILEYGIIAMSQCPLHVHLSLEVWRHYNTQPYAVLFTFPKHAQTLFVLTEEGCPTLDDRLKTLAMST